MEATGLTLPQSNEFVDAVRLDKSIVLSDGCTTTTLTTVDGQTMPVTFIVSQPLMENLTNGLAGVASDDDQCHSDPHLQRKGKSSTAHTVLHFPNDTKEDRKIVEPQQGTLAEKSIVGVSSLEHDTLTSVSRLEDFMDVVTTYKCKFCRFSCPWKSGLMSHIRCCHFNEKNCILTLKSEKEVTNVCSDDIKNEESTAMQMQSNCSEVTEESCQDLADELGNEELDTIVDSPRSGNEASDCPDSPMNERHIYLCGQCSDGFVSLEECKQHMMADHNLNLSQDAVKPLRKRGRPRKKQRKAETNPTKKRVKKEKILKSSKRQKSVIFKNLEDEFDCCIKRKLRYGYVNDRAFRCTRNGCGHRFTSDSNLNYHYSSHSSTGKAFTCLECQEEFDHWRGLSMHLWREHTIDIDLHSCTECNYKTFSFFKLDNHRKIHSEERAYICDTCGKGFKQISQLRNHIVIHMDRKNLPEKRWYSEQECDTCGRKFSDTKCLRKHQQAVHNKLKPYICTFCGHLSARKAMLELHMRQHTGEKPFMCEHCEYRTGDHNSLRRHRMRHTGDKPYKCPHCPYACIQAISYKTHLRNKHPGMDGLFSCSLCTFKSVSKENYINHLSDHQRQVSTLEEEAIHSRTEQDVELAATTSDPSSVQMQLSDNALHQLEGILPGNMTAAQLIYSCLNAMSQEGVGLPPGVIPQTTTTSSDGTQTITIQLPSSQELESEPYYFTIQQQDGTTALLVPSADQSEEGGEMEGVQLTEQDISTAAASLDCQVLEDGEGGPLQTENSDLVIAHIESLTDPGKFNEILAGTEIQMQAN